MCIRMEPCKVAYSMKANPCPQIPAVLSKTQAWFEVSSIAEAETLQACGIAPDRMYCGLVATSQAELTKLETIGCRAFTFDTFRQAEKIKYLRYPSNKILRVRVNDLVVDSIGFGMPYDTILQNPDILKETDGLSFHISDHTDMNKTIAAVDRLVTLAEFSPSVTFLNIGGSYSLSGNDEDYRILRTHLKDIQQHTGLDIICEPGSAIVDTSMYALTRCVMVCEQEGFTDVFIDGGIPSGMMRKPGRIMNLTGETAVRRHFYRFFDTTSMKKLLFQMHLAFRIQEDDLLCLTDYGAYSYCYSNIFHSRPLPTISVIKEEALIEQLV